MLSELTGERVKVLARVDRFVQAGQNIRSQQDTFLCKTCFFVIMMAMTGFAGRSWEWPLFSYGRSCNHRTSNVVCAGLSSSNGNGCSMPFLVQLVFCANEQAEKGCSEEEEKDSEGGQDLLQ